MRVIIGVIVFLPIIRPRNFTCVRENCDSSGAAFMFFFRNI